jgi:Domain of unknown function (DUF4376)
MSVYVYYNSDGRITAQANVPLNNNDQFLTLADSDVFTDYRNFYVDSNSLIQPIPASPNTAYVFDYATKAWIDPRTLAEAQADQVNVIELAYEEASTQNVAYTSVGGIAQTYQADTDSQTIVTQTINALALVKTVPPNFYWKAADNTLVPFTYDDLLGLASAMWQQGWLAFQNKTIKKQQIAAATTVAEVTAITW